MNSPALSVYFPNITNRKPTAPKRPCPNLRQLEEARQRIKELEEQSKQQAKIETLLKDIANRQKDDGRIMRNNFKELRERENNFPEFIRIPQNGELCPHSGFSRTKLYNLCRERKIRYKLEKSDDGNEKGIRLIVGQSLYNYLSGLPDYGDE